jgi:polyisoprenoid-binding protein YceI
MRNSFLILAALGWLTGTSVQAQVTAAPTVTYNLDPTHTTVIFEVDHVNTSTLRGRFDRKEGRVQLDREAKTGTVQVSIEAQSVSTGVTVFDKSLTGEKFFNAAQFPQMNFESTKIEFDGDKVKAVHGRLTLLGQTHPLTLNALRFNCYMNPMLKREVCGGDFEATFDRTQWGMNFGLNFGAPRDVHLLIQAEGIRQ